MKRKQFVVLLLMLVMAGCNGTSQERLDGLAAFLGIAKKQSELVNDDIATIQQTIADLQVAANDPALSPEDAAKIKAMMETVAEKLSIALEVKVKVDKAISDAEAKIAEIAANGNTNVGDEIQAAGHTITAAGQALPPPFGVYAGIAGTILAAIGGIIAKRKGDALTNVVRTVDKAKKDLTKDQIDAFDTVLRKQREPTRAAVRKIRAA